MAATERQPTGARPDPAQIRAWWDALVRPGDVHEARIPKTRRNGPRRLFGVASGYFDDGDAFARAVGAISGLDAEGVYLTLNPVDPDLLARCANRLQDGRPTTTADADIVRRRHLLVDIDPVRPSGISASDAERALALERRDAVAQALADLGWPPPVATLATGNGGGLLYRLRLDNTPDALALVERTLRGLAATFNDGRVVIDTTTANAARIAKVPGTVAAKGDDLPGRPWRTATANLTGRPLPVPDALLEAIAVSAPEPRAGDGAGAGDIRDRMHAAGLDWTEREKTYGTVFELNRCLTSDDHTDGACVIEFASGALAYKCQHNRCAAFGWSDVRERLGFGERAAGPRVTIGGRAPGGDAMHGAAPTGGQRSTRPQGAEAREEVAFAPTPVPEAALYGWFGDYVSLVAPTTEGAAALHLGSALALAAAMIGRHVFTTYASDELYANLFVLLIGPAGRAKKDTAIKRALKLPQLPGPRMIQAPFSVLRDIGSAEGLIDALRERPNILLYVTEFAKLLGNARRQSTNTIIPQLMAAFDTPPILQNKVKGNPLEARLPYLTIIGAIQPDILGRQMIAEDVASGFANRWLYFVGGGTGPLPSAPNLDREAAWRLYDALYAAIHSYGEGTDLPLLPEARSRWDAWYMADYERPVGGDEEDTMRNRLPVMVQKVALIYAISDQAPGIGDRHIAAAIELVEWMWANLRRLVRTWGEMPDANIERKVIETLDRKGPMLQRKLHQSIGHRMGPGVFSKVIKAMRENGTIVPTADGKLALVND